MHRAVCAKLNARFEGLRTFSTFGSVRDISMSSITEFNLGRYQQYRLISSSLTADGVSTPISVNSSAMYDGGV